MENNKFIREEVNEYDINDAIVYKDTVISFCKYFKEEIGILKNKIELPDNYFIKNFFLENLEFQRIPNVKLNDVVILN
jgi:hypothetical protein